MSGFRARPRPPKSSSPRSSVTHFNSTASCCKTPGACKTPPTTSNAPPMRLKGWASPRSRPRAFLVYGILLRNTGQIPEAEKYLKRAVDAAIRVNDPLIQCNAFLGYGLTIAANAGRFQEAAEFLKRAAEAAEFLSESPLTRCNVFMEYGECLLHNNPDDPEIASYLKRAADEAEQLGSPLTLCNAYMYYGRLLIRTKQYEEAGNYLKRAADVGEELDDPLTKSNVFAEYGTLLRLTGRDKEATEYSNQATEAAQELDDPLTKLQAARQAAHLHFGQQQFGLALTELLSAQDCLHRMLVSNRYPQGIGNLLGMYSDVFDLGLASAAMLHQKTKAPGLLLHCVTFADGLKAVSVREGLRRHSKPPVPQFESANGWPDRRTGRGCSTIPAPANRTPPAFQSGRLPCGAFVPSCRFQSPPRPYWSCRGMTSTPRLN